MSCIVGFARKGKIYIGADSCATSNGGEERTRKDPKIFSTGEYLIGFCGSPRIGQLLYMSWSPPEKFNYVIESIREIVIKGGAIASFQDGGECLNCQLMIGYKGKIFEVGNDFQVAEYYEEYNAIGSGRPHALSSFFETSRLNLKPLDQVVRALRNSEYFCNSVRSPFRIMTNIKPYSSKYKELPIIF